MGCPILSPRTPELSRSSDPARRHSVASLAILAVALLTLGFSCGGRGGDADGPLSGSQPGEVGIPLEVGKVVTVGYAALFNGGERDATVEKVQLVPPGGVELVGVRTLLLPRDGGGIISLPDFPPIGYPTRSLADQGVVAGAKPRPPGEPEPALELILGVRAARPGVFRSDQVEVTYTVGKRRFVERYPVQITLCAPASSYLDRCTSDQQPRS